MHLSTIVLTLLAAAAPLLQALPSPSAQTGQYSEDKPWKIHDLIIFHSNTSSPINTTIRFYLTDQNKGVEVDNTYCRIDMGQGTDPDDGTFYPCKNSSVSFKLQDKKFWIQHSYYDPSIGQPPWGGVEQYGNVDTSNWTATNFVDGRLLWQSSLELKCTETAA
jgi:hypothetical protein